MTDIQVTPKWKDVKPEGFYVYVHKYASGPKQGQVFYVGKGKDDRAWERYGRNRRWIRTARKYGVIVDVVKDKMIEVCALTFEKIMISFFDITELCNVTLGGDGTTGMTHSDETISKMSKTVYCSNGMRFISANKARIWLVSEGKNKANTSAIHQCCNGSIRSAYGYCWSYTENVPEYVYKGDRISETSARRMVFCSDGSIFPSLTDAQNWLRHQGISKASSSSITTCARGGQKTAYGFKWRYVLDMTEMDVLGIMSAQTRGDAK